MTFWILTVILVEGLFCGISHAEDTPMVRCEASAVHIGGEGQVTCHYPMDLSHIDCVVSIEQFVDDSEKTVLDCVRDRISQCNNVRQGYRITNVTGNTLTVTIPKVTDEHMGRYGCSLADRMTSYGYDLCTFEVKNRKSRCEASVENIGGRGQVTCHYPMDLTGVHCVVDIGQFVDGAETHILSCMWKDITQHDCTDIRQGYTITNFTGNTLTVTIPEVTDEHRGRYRCSLVDEIIHDYELCDVVVKNRPLVHCEASAVHIGGEGQVTCHYPMDLSLNEYAVSIEQFVDESEITVLDCVWGGIRQCDNVRQDYRITDVTGNTLTVTIPKVTDEHMGRYGCSLADRMTSYASDLCTFEVKGTTPHSSQPESSSEKAAADQSDADKGMSGGTVTLLVIGFIVITVVLDVVFLTYRRCRRQERNNTATAKFDNRADSQEKEVSRVNLDDHLKDTDAITGGKGTKHERPNSSPGSSDSGYGDTKTKNGDTTGSRFNSPENREMAENAERQDAASDAEGTTDNTAPLLSVQESLPRQDAELKEEEQDKLLVSF